MADGGSAFSQRPKTVIVTEAFITAPGRAAALAAAGAWPGTRYISELGIIRSLVWVGTTPTLTQGAAPSGLIPGPATIGTSSGTLTVSGFSGLILDSGTGPGSVTLGPTNASSVAIGRAGITTTVNGSLAMGAAADASALVTLASTTHGLLLPRMTTTQRDAIAAPASGLLIYNTTTNKLNFRAAAAWEAVTSA
jgi:hypothetical protein